MARRARVTALSLALVARASAAHERVTSADCAPCHERAVREWRETAHAMAWRDEVFQRGYAEERMAFCRGCHAPLADASREPDEESASEGVSCVACHTRAVVHVATRGLARADQSAMTALRCGGCHQFDFPVDRGGERPLWRTSLPMQNTVREWASSEAAHRGDDCVSCHIPEGTHRLRGVEDRAFVASAVAVDVRARRVANRWILRATLTPTGAGHAFPTGDLFRSARLVAWVDEGAERERVFTRRFEETTFTDDRGETHFMRAERYDGRLAPPGEDSVDEVALTVPARGDAPLRWRWEYRRTTPDVARREGLADDLVRVTLAEGTIAPRSTRR